MKSETAQRLDQTPAATRFRAHPLDTVVARLSAKSKIFSAGWGDEALLAKTAESLSYTSSLQPIDVQWHTESAQRKTRRRDGKFPSPLDLLPPETATAHVRSWSRDGNETACVMLAASRDEGYRVREFVFRSLLQRGMDLYLLENPYYGQRRTAVGPSLATASDHVLMTLGTLCEARALLDWLRPQYKKLVIAGYSMGGHMAAITAAISPYPVACAALATGASAVAIYTRGLLSLSVDLEALANGSRDVAAARERLEALFEPADLTQHPLPIRADAAVLVGGRRDGYILQSETERLHRYWAGSTLHWIDAGHFSALVSSRRALCDAVVEAANKL